jgi:hypothetical protein
MDAEKTAGPAVDFGSKLGPEDCFQFSCGPDVPCFTECCGRLQLMLTPFDALRLRRRLRLSSERFLDEYAIIRQRTAHGFPEVMMRMNIEGARKCPFVTKDGCTVYADRPAACRIYPLGRASTRDASDREAKEFYFVVREDHCRGFEQTRTWTVREWTEDQGVDEYNRFNDRLMELYVMKSRRPALSLGERHKKMFIMACYNTDKFRDFVFDSGFLARFDLDPALVERLRSDDLPLLELAFEWLKFAFFQEPTLKIKATDATG